MTFHGTHTDKLDYRGDSSCNSKTNNVHSPHVNQQHNTRKNITSHHNRSNNNNNKLRTSRLLVDILTKLPMKQLSNISHVSISLKRCISFSCQKKKKSKIWVLRTVKMYRGTKASLYTQIDRRQTWRISCVSMVFRYSSIPAVAAFVLIHQCIPFIRSPDRGLKSVYSPAM